MSSYSHQFLATMFLSQDQIYSIIGTDIEDVTQDTSAVQIDSTKSSDITVNKIDGKGQFNGYALIIKDPERVKIGLTSKLGEEGETTSQMASENNAVAAINGGGFVDNSSSGKAWTGTGALPTFFVIHSGKVQYSSVSDSYDFDDDDNLTTSVVAIDKKGKLIIGKHSISELKKLNVQEAVVFGPTLVVNGKGTFKGDGGQGMTARTAIGQCSNGDIVMVVLDGRRIDMPGATLGDMRDIMLKYGAVNAVNLDGGSSSTMYYNGKVINDPCDPLGERSIATCIYVTK